MKNFFLLFILLFYNLSVNAEGFTIEKHVDEVPDGYNFWLAVPEDTSEPMPVIIFLHGSSLRGTDLERVKRYGTLDAVIKGRDIPAYVIAPQIPGRGGWEPSRVKNVLEYVKMNQNIDDNRVYVVGMSLGGYGTIDYAATYPDEVAAAVGMCGGATVKDLSGLNEVPLWIIHGTADSAVPVSQSDKVVEAIRNVDPETPRLTYDRVPGMNHSRPARVFYLPELYEWLFMHSLDQPERPLSSPVRIEESLLKQAYQGLSFRR